MADEGGDMDVDHPAQPSTSAPATKKRFEVKKVSYHSKSWDRFFWEYLQLNSWILLLN